MPVIPALYKNKVLQILWIFEKILLQVFKNCTWDKRVIGKVEYRFEMELKI